jgi:inositol-pentakisphosphate 2-kinase
MAMTDDSSDHLDGETDALTNDDASLWEYVGEGGKHAVFACRSDGEESRGRHLLRISKAAAFAGRDERSRNEREVKRTMFHMEHVVAPYLDEFVTVPRMVALEATFVQKLHRIAMHSGKIPSARLNDWQRDETIQEHGRCYGMLMEDYCRNTAGRTSYTIELKPKAGYLAFSPLVHPSYRHVKYRQSRFRSLQVLHKMGLWKKGWIGDHSDERTQVVSWYEPLDLFSQDASRVQNAVRQLWRTPQNNLRIYSNANGAAQSVPTSDAPPFLETILVSVFTRPKGQDLLRRILKWQQQLDILDVDGAGIVYQRLVDLLRNESEDRLGPAEAQVLGQALVDDVSRDDLPPHDGARGHHTASGHGGTKNEALPGLLEASPYRYKLGEGAENDDIANNNDDNFDAPLIKFCQTIHDFRHKMAESGGTLPRSPAGAAYVQQTRQRLLDTIRNDFSVSDCIYLLRNWLLSLTMCDVSIFVTLEETQDEDGYVMVDRGSQNDCRIVRAPDATVSGTTTARRFRYSLHVIDCDPKPAKKLDGRAEKEKVFARLP